MGFILCSFDSKIQYQLIIVSLQPTHHGQMILSASNNPLVMALLDSATISCAIDCRLLKGCLCEILRSSCKYSITIVNLFPRNLQICLSFRHGYCSWKKPNKPVPDIFKHNILTVLTILTYSWLLNSDNNLLLLVFSNDGKDH